MTTAVSLAQSAAPGVSLGFKNRIINGGMTIDQRNAGASVSADSNVFGVDRFKISTAYVSKATIQQSTTAPAGFKNSILLTSSAATSTGSGDYMTLNQLIEGQNVADFGWGTADAVAITVSFWVRSSLTGTFSCVINNAGSSRSYVAPYTISAANTWEKKTITIAGDTSGTWLTTNAAGLILRWSIAMGSAYSTSSANTWLAGDYEGYTGQVQVLNTNGATFYITGVQLEVGTAATNFEFRPYGTELQLCQRYYVRLTTGNIYTALALGLCSGATSGQFHYFPPQPMRTTPSFGNSGSGTLQFSNGASAQPLTSLAIASTQSCPVSVTISVGASGGGMTAGNAYRVEGANNGSAFVDFSAEL